MKIVLSLVLATGLLALAGAQEPPANTGRLSDTLEIYPATVVAIHPRSYESTELELTHIDQMAQDGGSLLNQLPAFSSIRKSGAYGLDPVFRGFKYEQLNVVLNGVQTASAACPNRMDPPTSQLVPNMIERVEVLKGPHALRYGCSFGATINFIPVAPSYSESPSTYGRVSGAYESNGNILRSEGLLGFSGRAYDLGLFASWAQGQDYTDGDAQTVQSDFSKGSFGGQLGVRLSDQHQLKWSVTRNMARDVDFAALPMDLRKDDTWMFSVSHAWTIRNRDLRSWNTSLYGSLVDHLMDNYSKPLDPRMVDAYTQAYTTNVGGRTEGSWGMKRSRLYAGLDFRVEGAEGERVREFLMGPNAGKVVSDNAWQGGQITRSGLFGEYHLHALGIHWVASGRLEINLAGVKDPDPSFLLQYPDPDIAQVNPGISLGGSKELGRHVSLGLWLGRAVRSGSLTERYINFFPVGMDPYEMLGNPLIEPEINNQADLQVSWKGTHTVLSLDLFASYLQDYISSTIDTSLSPRMPSSPGVRRYSNIDQAFKTGFELAWTQRLRAGLQHQFSLAFTYGQNLSSKEALPEIAPFDLRYRLSGNYLKNRLHPWAKIRYAAAQNRVSQEFGESSSPAFALLDMGIAFSIKPKIRISAGINNLLDRPYYEHLSRATRGPEAAPIHAPGRSLILSFNLDFR